MKLYNYQEQTILYRYILQAWILHHTLNDKVTAHRFVKNNVNGSISNVRLLKWIWFWAVVTENVNL